MRFIFQLFIFLTPTACMAASSAASWPSEEGAKTFSGTTNLAKPHTIYTIGHSTHTLKEFIELLHAHKIPSARDAYLVDVRSIPKSRHVPWFNDDNLCRELHKESITYIHMPQLGGLRHADKDSINQGWRNKSFRGYADYMQTSSFHEGLEALNKLAEGGANVTIMCAEAVPWRCHRSLIADAELVHGLSVLHILSRTNIRTHSLTSFAVIDKTKKPGLFYPEEKTKNLSRPGERVVGGPATALDSTSITGVKRPRKSGSSIQRVVDDEDEKGVKADVARASPPDAKRSRASGADSHA